MCPACLASAGLIVGSVISSGGFAALFVKIQAKQRPINPNTIQIKGEKPVKIADPILLELDQEAQTTKRVLDRIPEDKLTWKPTQNPFLWASWHSTLHPCLAASPRQ